jgi:hypothetical protein
MWLVRFLQAKGGKPEVERMTAATAKVFSPIGARLVEAYEMAHQHARQRVPDNRECLLRFDEGVAADTGVFDRF